MSEIENHWAEVFNIESEMKIKLMALRMDWHDAAAMRLLAGECRSFGPEQAAAAYASHDRERKLKVEFFALVSIMMRTMESAANDGREVHAGDAWKAFSKYLYV